MQLTRRFTSPAGDLFSEFDRLFRHSLGHLSNGGSARLPREFSLYETDVAWLLRVDLPGLRKEDLEVTVVDGILKLSGSTENGLFESGIEQSLRLPKSVNTSAITAKLENGILSLSLPKAEAQTPDEHRININ